MAYRCSSTAFSNSTSTLKFRSDVCASCTLASGPLPRTAKGSRARRDCVALSCSFSGDFSGSMPYKSSSSRLVQLTKICLCCRCACLPCRPKSAIGPNSRSSGVLRSESVASSSHVCSHSPRPGAQGGVARSNSLCLARKDQPGGSGKML